MNPKPPFQGLRTTKGRVAGQGGGHPGGRVQRVRGLYGLPVRRHARFATGDCLVLNSVANVEKALKHLDGYERIDCYLDRDEAGRRAMEALRTRYGGKVTDRSGIYQGCKDLNEYLQQVSRKQQKNNNLKSKNNEHTEQQEQENINLQGVGTLPVRRSVIHIRIVRRRYGHPAILSLHGGNHARAEQGHKGADGGNPL